MKKLLIISASVPYGKVGHAGGKTHYYYLKTYAKHFDIKLITFAESGLLEYSQDDINTDLKYLNIDFTIIERKWTKREKILNIESSYNLYNRNCRMVLNTDEIDLIKCLKKQKEKGYSPDIIVLEWTQMLLACRNIKKFFPNAKIVASEHDVSFLNYERKYLIANGIKRFFYKKLYRALYKKELKLLKQTDLVLVHNEKDKRLLLDNGIDDSLIHTIVPYYTHLSTPQKRKPSNNLLFFGAMGREENYLSVIWFIENVFSKIDGFRFIILGSDPNPILQKYKTDNIIITDYVNNIQPYFDDALCFVSPLVSGAGIKVKVLEAFTSGIPVLTNSIGIEGIPAKNGHDYIHCEKPEDYISSILDLSNDLSKCEKIGTNGKEFIEHNFDMEKSAKNAIKRLEAIS